MNGLLIGRFQPFHLGHLDAVSIALDYHNVENLFICIGSSNKSHERKNPFSAEERRRMILQSIDLRAHQIYDVDEPARIKIFDIPDVGDHEKWTFEIDKIVPKYDVVFTNDEFTKTLFEKRKIRVIPIPLQHREKFSGTNIRNLIRQDQEDGVDDWRDLVPRGTRNVLDNINARDRLDRLYMSGKM